MAIHRFRDLSELLDLARGRERYLILDVGMSPTVDPISDAQGSLHREISLWLGNKALVAPVGPESEDEVARTLCIRGFPTLIAFKAGQEPRTPREAEGRSCGASLAYRTRCPSDQLRHRP